VLNHRGFALIQEKGVRILLVVAHRLPEGEGEDVSQKTTPYFELHMANPPATNFDYDYDDVKGKSLKELKKLGKTLRIHAFNSLFHPEGTYIPFPYEQFTYDKRTYEAHEYGSQGEACGSYHFDTPQALDVHMKSISAPEGVCGWGGPEYAVGALVVTPEELYDWLQKYEGKKYY